MRDYIADVPEEYREAVVRSLTGKQHDKPARPANPHVTSKTVPSLGNALALMESFAPTEAYEPEPPHQCPRCNDTGWLRPSYEGREPPPIVECRACDLVASRRRARFHKLAPVQPPYDRYSFDSFPVRAPAMAKVAAGLQKLALGDPVSLYLSGSVGCGKTGLATCLYQAWVAAGTPGIWFVVPRLLDHIRAGFDRSSSSYTADDLVQAVYDVPLLMLDDLGAERMTDWVAEVFYKIVYCRQDDGKATIVTSNYGLSELVDHMAGKAQSSQIDAERIASRLKGLCGERIYRVEGPDLR